MPSKKPKKFFPLFATGFLTLAFASYLYINVLPYYFSNQWKPTSDNLNASGTYDTENQTGEFLGKKVISSDFASSQSRILGDSESDDTAEKHIEVDLSKQMVYAFEGDEKVMEFLISSGKWGKTPTGEFTIEYKTTSQKMSGGNKALRTYYYLPNVPYIQFFGNDEIPWGRGFSFHGTYWHDKFGTPQSHGCINMRTEDAKKLFEWTTPEVEGKRTIKASDENKGTKVIIYGEAPE